MLTTRAMNGEHENLIGVGLVIPVSYLFGHLAEIVQALDLVHRGTAIPLTAAALGIRSVRSLVLHLGFVGVELLMQ